MKKVLSSLMAFVVLQAQSYALSGGPVFGGTATLNVVGTYAGVLVPDAVSDDVNARTSAASIGLFSLGVPESGPSVGSAIVFVDGIAFNGAIIGVADPGNGRLRGVIDALSTFVIQTAVQTGVDQNGVPVIEIVESNIFAQGSIDTTIFTFGGQNLFGATASGNTRLIGTAEIDVFSELEADGSPKINSTATFTVDGFKQSDTTTTVTDLTFGSNINLGTP